MTYFDRTDKHINGYLPTYFDLAAKIGASGVVCELGVERGGSLELWQTLFPFGSVVGVDINETAVWPDGTHRVVMDQASADLPSALRRLHESYDLIVDDASHDGDATHTSYMRLWPLVTPGHWYVIEDWGVGYPGAPMYDPVMRTFARELVDDAHFIRDVASITYRRGLIVIQKTLV